MSPGGIISLVATAVGLLLIVTRILWSLHKGINLIEHLVTRVSGLENALSNGIRSDVRQAKESSVEACRLAGKAAQTAAVAHQQVQERGVNQERAINALRATVDAFANAALTDVAHIWDVLSDAGLDRRSE
jgi:hypothetical protein